MWFLISLQLSTPLDSFSPRNRLGGLELAISPSKVRPERDGQQRIEEHEPRANRHALDIIRLFSNWEDTCSENRATLPDEIEHRNADAALGVAALVVEHPGQDVGDGRKDAGRRKEDAQIAYADAFDGGEQNVPHASYD